MKRALIAAAAALVALACVPEPVTVPGPVKDARIVVKLADLPAGELDGIGSFALSIFHDGALERADVPLNFSSTARTLSFLDEPQGLPTTGTLSFTIEARDLLGLPLAIGGRSGVVDLDAPVADGAVPTLFALVARVGRPSPLAEALAAARSGHLAIAAGDGVVVVGGSDTSAFEWLDFANGDDCADGDCAGGLAPALPVPRRGAVAVSLAVFGDTCAPALRGSVLFGLGRDAGGAALADLWLFNPGALGTADALKQVAGAFTARDGAVAVAGRECRVVFAGGVDDAGARITLTEELTFGGVGGANVSLTEGPTLTGAARDAAVVSTGNALGEVLVVGGDRSPDPADGAAVFGLAAGALDLCELTDEECNGAAAALTCPRGDVSAALVEPGDDRAPILVFGDDCAAPEVFRSSTTAPFGDFLDVAPPPVPRRSGATLSALSARGALLAGGADIENAGAPSGDVSRFVLDDIDDDSAAGTWTPQGTLGSARADHAAAVVGGAVVVAGGVVAGGAATTSLEVVVPDAPAGAGP